MTIPTETQRPRNGVTLPGAAELFVPEKPPFERSSQERALEERIVTKNASIGVVGLGYVGLPLAVEFAEAGFLAPASTSTATGSTPHHAGRSTSTDVSDAELEAAVEDGRFRDHRLRASSRRWTDRRSACRRRCARPRTPTSLHRPAAEQVAQQLHAGQLVILETTTYPGTTEEVVLPCSRHGPHVGSDFFLAYSPERVDPGNASFQTRNIPKVVGGVTAACRGSPRALQPRVDDGRAGVLDHASPRW